MKFNAVRIQFWADFYIASNFEFAAARRRAFSTGKSWKCNELITSLHVIGNMKNRIFCYEKTIETIKTRKNVLKTERFNTFLWDFVYRVEECVRSINVVFCVVKHLWCNRMCVSLCRQNYKAAKCVDTKNEYEYNVIIIIIIIIIAMECYTIPS